MKDLAGNELVEGDRVAAKRGGRYNHLSLTTVIGFTPKMVKTSIGNFEGRLVVKIVEPSE